MWKECSDFLRIKGKALGDLYAGREKETTGLPRSPFAGAEFAVASHAREEIIARAAENVGLGLVGDEGGLEGGGDLRLLLLAAR